MRRSIGLLAFTTLCAFGCGPQETPADGGTDGGADLAPEICVNFPERFDVDTTVATGCYLALKTPAIAAGVTVTLAPGVKVVFSSEVAFSFSAAQALRAIGTAEAPILLTGAEHVRGYWKGLRFDGTSVASQLDHVTVEYAGNLTGDRDSAAIKLTADSRGVRIGIAHTVLRESLGWGLWATGSAVLTEFTANVLTSNTLGPASLDSATVGRLDATSIFTGNDVNRLHVRAYRLPTASTWDALDVPYYLASSLSLQVADLTIKPGARLIMAPEVEIGVSDDAAALIAAGTADKPIVFTGETAARGGWEGIVFDGSNNARNVLRYVTVEWAGNTKVDADSAAVKLIADSHGVQLRLDHVTLRQSQGYGLYLCASALVPQFTANVLTQNQLGPAMVDSSAAHQLLPDSTFTGNDVDRLQVRAQWVSKAVTWQDLGVPYVMRSSVTAQSIWTLAPGVKLEMEPQTAISVAGDDCALHAVGTAEKPIIITGAVKTRGSWDAIDFDTTRNGANALSHCVIEYGGGGARYGWNGMIHATADSHGVTLSVTDSTVQHSATYGIWLARSHSGSIAGNTYADNVSGDVFRAP